MSRTLGYLSTERERIRARGGKWRSWLSSEKCVPWEKKSSQAAEDKEEARTGKKIIGLRAARFFQAEGSGQIFFLVVQICAA
jgi:hypothetical protein